MLVSPEIPFEEMLRQRERLRACLPRHIADHELIRVVAAGTYGEVWLARNQLTGTYRALKIIWRDTFETAKPYEREFEAITRFEPISRQHPGFVHVLQTGRLQNGFYYIMELADSANAEKRDIDAESYQPATLEGSKKSLSVAQAIRIGISLSESLDVLHREGLIHRDIKPSNIIFVRGEPKLADIGLVTEISEANSVVGTNGFIAPEGPTSNRADIYALGKLLYEIATGRDRLEFPLLPDGASHRDRLMVELNHVLLKACHPNPAERHGSAEALRDELELLIQGRSIKRVRQLEKTLRMTKAWLVTACTAMVAGYFFLKSSEAKRTADAKLLEARIATAVAEGNSRVREGDYLGSVHPFAQAAQLDPKNAREQRLRLGSALASAPRIVARFHGETEATCFAENANILGSIVSNKVQLTDIGSGQVIRTLPYRPFHLAIDPEGRSLALIDGDHVTFVDLTTGREQKIQFSGEVWDVSMADVENYVVSTRTGEAYVFPGNRRVASDKPIFEGFLSESRKLLCILEKDGGFRVLDAATFKEIWRGRHKDPAYHALFFDSDRLLITSSYDRTAVVWDVETGKPLRSWLDQKGSVNFAAVSPDGRIIATGAEDNTVWLRDAKTLTELPDNYILYHPNRLTWVKFASNSRVVTRCTDGTTYVWSLEPPSLLTELPRTNAVPDRRVLVGPETRLTGSSNRVTGTLRGNNFSVELPGPVEVIAADPEFELIAVGTRDNTQAPHAVHLFNRSQQEVGKPMGHTDGVTFVTFSHSGKVIASGGEDYYARFWTREGEPRLKIRHKNQVTWITFSDDDNWVVTGCWDFTVRVWNAHSGIPVSVPLKVNNLISYVSFGKEDDLLIVNALRNYRMKLPFFRGPIEPILQSIPAPLNLDAY